MKNRTFASPLVLCFSVIVLALLGSVYFGTPRASALTKAQLTAIGSATPECKGTAATAFGGAVPAGQAGKEAIAECGAGYALGFVDTGPALSDTDISKGPCKSFTTLSEGPADCVVGYKLGQADAARAVSQAIPAGSTPSPDQIKALGSADPNCTPLKPPAGGLNSPFLNGRFDACVAGFTAGFNAGPTAAAQTAAKAAACNGSGFKGDCLTGFAAGAFDKKVAGTNAAAAAAAGAAGTPPPDTATAEKQLGCEFSTNPLTWFICPVVDTLVEAIKVIDNIITDQLTVNTSQIFCASTDNTCHAYYTAWQSFRNISLGLIVIAGLIAVSAQALGTELLDAYTIRKALPRILIAAVGVSVSWPLMQFFVNLSNDLGVGVRHLIYAPFANLPDKIDLSFGSNITNIFFGSAATGAAAVGAVPLWLGLGGVGVLLSYAATAGLAVLIAVLVLILRQIAITLLIILAPVAIICYVLPNTQRVYKFWWEAFSKALMMFPIIAAFIASGRIFSAIAISNGGLVNGIIGFGAYFAPYFLIPLTFRFAGGALRGIGGFVNDRGRGSFDRLKQYRQETGKSRRKAVKTGGLYRNKFGEFTNPITGKTRTVSGILNSIGNNTIDAPDTLQLHAGARGGPIGRALFGRKSRDLQSQIAKQTIEQTTKAAQEAQLRYHSGRGIAGQHQYVMEDLKKYDEANGLTGKTAAEGSAVAALLDNFAEHDKNGNVMRREPRDGQTEGDIRFRAPGGEKEFNQLASIYDHGASPGAREGAAELRAKAIELDTFKGAGKEETQRADTQFMGMMVTAQAGRLENHELVNYYNDQVDAGDPEGALLRLERLQEMAAPKRTSQARGYGIGFKDVNGKKVAYDVYQDPAGEAAQASFRRTSSGDIGNGKAEDLVDPQGHISGWGQTIIAGTSDYEMENVIDPNTKKRVVQRKLAPVTMKNANGTDVVDDHGNVVYEKKNGQIVHEHIKKNEQGLLNAQAARGKIQSIEGYAQGDTGLGGQIYRLMEQAKIPYKYGAPGEPMSPSEQARRQAQQQQQQQQADNPIARPDPEH